MKKIIVCVLAAIALFMWLTYERPAEVLGVSTMSAKVMRCEDGYIVVHNEYFVATIETEQMFAIGEMVNVNRIAKEKNQEIFYEYVLTN